ncbi:T-complex protein 1 subunit epsilon [Zea mays]|uniref:T-complex protein 1 subunit epsilon n=1 Tax=Zea mays TaxID=4577 RepID=A0A1D6M0H3_MAIZE|nr:T-complex protein 1 subunit epsilon [Zea mays]
MERSEQFHPSKPCVRRRAQPISPVAAAQPTHITAATAETATAYLFVNRVPSLGCSCRIQATRKEGGEHHDSVVSFGKLPG